MGVRALVIWSRRSWERAWGPGPLACGTGEPFETRRGPCLVPRGMPLLSIARMNLEDCWFFREQLAGGGQRHFSGPTE
eukprot:297609-Pyramimonas_sp.AAC.1